MNDQPRLAVLAAVLLAAACGGKGKGAAPPSTSAAPTGPVTVEKLTALAQDPAAFAALLDPATGVVDLHLVTSPADEEDGGNPEEIWVKHLCGAEAAALLEEVRTTILARAKEAEHEKMCSPIVAIEQTEPPADAAYVAPSEQGGDDCLWPGVMEYDISYELVFRPDGEGRRLSRIEVIDVGSMVNEERAAERKALVEGNPRCD